MLRARRRQHWLSVFAACALLAAAAQSNGRFPSAGLLVIDPTDPQHLVVRTTFGLLDVDEATRTATWTCEAALELGFQEDPMLAVTANGSTVVATSTGVRTRSEACAFRSLPALQGDIVSDLTLDRTNPHRLLAFRVRGLPRGEFDSQILESLDDGASFQPLGPALPRDLLPLSIDTAPSDASRVYLSARKGSADGYVSVLLASTNGGQSFAQVPVPGTSSLRLAFIAAVHPLLADRVYLRVNDPEGNALLSSANGGASIDTLFTANGKLLGFAAAPDGERIAFGGPADGLWTAAADGSSPEQRSTTTPNCLTWGEQALYACGTSNDAAPFLVGRSVDEGRTFVPVLQNGGVCDALDCDASSQAGQACVGAWAPLAAQLGASCAPDAAPPILGSAGAADGGGEGGVGASTATGGGGGDADSSATESPRAGGGCDFTSETTRTGVAWCAALALAAAFLRRRVARGASSGTFR